MGILTFVSFSLGLFWEKGGAGGERDGVMSGVIHINHG
jgi:hypothetical protein